MSSEQYKFTLEKIKKTIKRTKNQTNQQKKVKNKNQSRHKWNCTRSYKRFNKTIYWDTRNDSFKNHKIV